MRKRSSLNNLIKQTVRKLRKNQTESEEILWQVLRDRKLLGKKFLRQYPIIFEWDERKRFLIADFYCHECKLIIELDGGIHQKQKDYDTVRDYALRSLGLNIVRFNNEKIKANLKEAVERLKEQIASSPSLAKRGGKRG